MRSISRTRARTGAGSRRHVLAAALAAACAAFAAAGKDEAKASSKPHIVWMVADDLGFDDLGYHNGNKVHTPYIDTLIREEAVMLSSYYTYKVCSPSRASMLTGRYPWGVGFFDMSNDGNHCIRTETDLLPAVLAKAGYRSHFTGKWDVGRVLNECTPTYRGYESFLGYYTACTADYWYHGAPGGSYIADKCGGVDFSNNTLPSQDGIQGAAMRGPRSVNGTYDRDLFQQRAIDVIEAHDPAEPLYLHVAWHNVHDSCPAGRTTGSLVLDAPAETVDLYRTTKEDPWKVQAAMTTELDYGIGNVTEALKRRGMWNNTVMVFVSDNGGPLDHSNNAPRRDGKASWGEGGVNVVAFVASPLLAESAKGTEWHGVAHSSDWYVTLAEGLAGVSAQGTGPRAPDGHNLWDALNSNGPSPRTDVIHGLLGSDVVPPLNRSVCKSCASASARFGDWKIILKTDNLRLPQAWPEPGSQPVPFGNSGGAIEPGTDHARSVSAAVRAKEEHSESGTWLFNLKEDRFETTNLANEPKYAGLVANLTARLAAAAQTAPAPAFVYPTNYSSIECSNEEKYGFLEPVDWITPDE